MGGTHAGGIPPRPKSTGMELSSAFSNSRTGSDMQHKHLRFGKGFRVSVGNARAQAAEMVIPPGECEGGPDNRHRGADQWLFVVSGRGIAIVNGKRHARRDGSLVLIERGDTHEIGNSG